MSNTKKLTALLLAALMLTLTACGGSSSGGQSTTEAEQTTEEESAAEEETEEAAESEDASEETASAGSVEFNGKLQGPFIMTTCGQSTGSVMMHMVATQAGIDSVDDHTLTSDTFSAGDAKTLVVTTGTSGKGMGAAGTDVNAEIDRCVALIETAREAGLTIVCAHVEGMSRRTDSSDQASIDAIMPLADVIVVVEESDSDGLFSDYAAANDIPIIITEDALDLSEYME